MKFNISLKLRALRIYFGIGSNARIDYERLVEQQRLDKISQEQQIFDRISQKAHAYSLGKSFGVSNFGQNAEIVNFHASPKSRPASFGLKNEGLVLTEVEYDTNDPEHVEFCSKWTDYQSEPLFKFMQQSDTVIPKCDRS
jgi:hypothetical protein